MIDEEKRKKVTKEEIKIDYENIDVADIMDQIKRKAAKKAKKQGRERGMQDWRSASPSLYPLEPEEAQDLKAKIRRLMLKIMRPFAPIIKLFILPVYEELREAVRILDQTNKRLDSLNNAINDVNQNLNNAINDVNQKLDQTADNLVKKMEYTKLLHNLSHNIVVELSKLKIEEENLKLKIRIMEKDFESLGLREKALEKHIFK